MNKRDLYNTVYKLDEEADAFIQKHLKELPAASYNDVTDIHPQVIQVKNVSVIIDNVNLLKNPKARNLMNDYFAGMTVDAMLAKYEYKDKEVLYYKISYLKKVVRKRLIDKMERDLLLETKKLTQKVLNENVVKELVLKNSSSRFVLKLAKVPYKNKLNYKFYDEDVLVLINKLQLVKKYLSPLDKKRIERYDGLTDMNVTQFKLIADYCNKFRWVNEDGYLLPKSLDDALSNILSFNENEQVDFKQLKQ